MSVLYIFAWTVPIVLVASTVAVVVFLAMLPGVVAKRRNHPWGQAVTVAGWVTLLLGFARDWLGGCCRLWERCVMRHSFVLPAILVLSAFGVAYAQDEAELAKKLANPISSLISVPFQFNYDKGFGPSDGGRTTLNIQPVRYYAETPTNSPRWGARFNATLLFPAR